MRDAIRYLEEGEEGDPFTEEIDDLIQEVQLFIDADDANNALVILQTITETCSEKWDDIDEYGWDNYDIADEVMKAAPALTTSMKETFTLARTLLEIDRQQQALEIARKGLTLSQSHCL